MLKTENRIAGPIPCDPDLLHDVADYAWFQASRDDRLTAEDADDVAQITSEIILSRPSLWRESARTIKTRILRSAIRLHVKRQREKLTSGCSDTIDGDSVCRRPEHMPDESRAAADVRDDLKIRIEANKLRRNREFMSEQFAGFIAQVLHEVCDEMVIDGEHVPEIPANLQIQSSIAYRFYLMHRDSVVSIVTPVSYRRRKPVGADRSLRFCSVSID